MKNAIITGLCIGVFSLIWMFVMHYLGYSPQKDQVSSIEYLSSLIPAAGLFFGIKNYRDHECRGKMGFLEALIQCFKILIAGGIFTVFVSILYIDEISKGSIGDFSGRIFGALLVGLLLSLGVSALLTTKHNKVD
jgi:hypothetical protein